MMNRRRFLTISAVALATPIQARRPTTRWQGFAMGAEVSLTLDGDPATAESAITKVRAILEHCENLFSLYRPNSALSRLNRTGVYADPEPDFLQLLWAWDQAYLLTRGRFDPTVQPLWLAEAASQDTTRALELIDWSSVQISSQAVTLEPGQALTLNGIAQGFMTDRVVQALRQSGWDKILVNVGEFYAGGRHWTLGISDPDYGIIDTLDLKKRAVATSRPKAMRLRSGQFLILSPTGRYTPHWSTVSVQAADATTADALSTAFCHATESEIADILLRVDGAPSAICVRPDGFIQKIRT